MVLHIQRPGDGREVQTEDQVNLPPDLLARGWRLIIRTPNRMFAVSASRGCTETLPTIGAVIAQARGLTRFCGYINQKKATGHHDQD